MYGKFTSVILLDMSIYKKINCLTASVLVITFANSLEPDQA